MKTVYLSFTRKADNIMISIWEYDYETSKVKRVWRHPGKEFINLGIGAELSLTEWNGYNIFDNTTVRIDVITEAELFIISL